MISILVLTKNEESSLPECLASVGWSDDIHVYDSFSTDRTVEVARAAGAHVTQRSFDDWATHQNWALRNIPFKHPWVLYVDADERVTPELAAAVLAAIAEPDGKAAFEIQRRDFLDGRWLRHVQASPYYLRLFRPERMRYERIVNPKSVPDGPVGRVAGYLDHYPFSKGIEHWLARHNAYSTLEARQTAKEDSSGARVGPLVALFARDFHVRRAHQKLLFSRLPARPLLKFLVLYVFKRGFLDGREGLRYAILQSIYEYMIVLKRRELSRLTADAVVHG
jgi:glycosyltransferase involved in cell wall biosynthesis